MEKLKNNTTNINTKWYMQLFLPLYIILGSMYLYFLFTLSAKWILWLALPFFILETYRVIYMIIAMICMRTISYPVYKELLKNKTVDIFIPTYNEPEEIIRLTASGAKNVRGVRNIFILDDGNRKVIEKLAKELAVYYYARKTNQHAKAGNMNFGLRFSDADFVIFCDADHVPQPEFIERTLGYFRDEKLAFVQTPQSFYNLNSIQHRTTKQIPHWNEQTMFYESIQPAKNVYNAAFFCGTSAILRRKAIDSVGGFATGTATEDIHTSIRLHSKGWKSLFINEQLAFGIAPIDLKEYHRQRVRWGAGSLGLVFRTKDSPLIISGLTFMQRLSYLNSVFAFLQGPLKLLYYAFPIVLLFFPSSMQNILLVFTLCFSIPFLLFSLFLVKIYSRGTYHYFFTEQYNVANIISNFVALKGVLRVEKKFGVSAKVKKHTEDSVVKTALIFLFCLMLLADFYACYFIIRSHESVQTVIYSTLLPGVVWNTINMIFILSFLLYLYNYNKKQARKTAFSFSSQYYHFIATRNNVISDYQESENNKRRNPRYIAPSVVTST